MHTPTQLAERLRAEGRKVTPQREAVFRVLAGNEQHPTAEAIHHAVVRDLPMVSLRTVYQVLYDLTELGEIQALDLGTGSARFDPNLDAHHHLVCTSCGAVRDVPTEGADTLTLAADEQFIVDRVDIVFRGTCARCAI
jgi:Fe2+ or Zn2+ uptake regulation protein